MCDLHIDPKLFTAPDWNTGVYQVCFQTGIKIIAKKAWFMPVFTTLIWQIQNQIWIVVGRLHVT